MSLVKIDKNSGHIRDNWLEKKSTKRLKVILKKTRRNYMDLWGIANNLKRFNLPAEEVLKLASKYVKISATLNVIIYRRDEKNTLL